MEINNLLGVLINGVYGLINFLIDGVALILPSFSLGDFLTGAFSTFSPHLGVINYFVPFGLMVDISAAWLAAVLIWYVAQAVLRFVRLSA